MILKIETETETETRVNENIKKSNANIGIYYGECIQFLEQNKIIEINYKTNFT